MLQGSRLKARIANLAFMAVGALLGVKIFGCHAKHVVTLYANTVKSRLSRRRSFLLGSMRLWLGRFRAHGGILAQWCAIGNPGGRAGHVTASWLDRGASQNSRSCRRGEGDF